MVGYFREKARQAQARTTYRDAREATSALVTIDRPATLDTSRVFRIEDPLKDRLLANLEQGRTPHELTLVPFGQTGDSPIFRFLYARADEESRKPLMPGTAEINRIHGDVGSLLNVEGPTDPFKATGIHKIITAAAEAERGTNEERAAARANLARTVYLYVDRALDTLGRVSEATVIKAGEPVLPGRWKRRGADLMQFAELAQAGLTALVADDILAEDAPPSTTVRQAQLDQFVAKMGIQVAPEPNPTSAA